jgi:hypothetical protein
MKKNRYHILSSFQFSRTRILLTFCFLFFTHQTFSQRLQIGIMRAFTSSTVQFSYGDGIYEFRSDTTIICEMTKDG